MGNSYPETEDGAKTHILPILQGSVTAKLAEGKDIDLSEVVGAGLAFQGQYWQMEW